MAECLRGGDVEVDGERPIVNSVMESDELLHRMESDTLLRWC